MLQKHPPAKMAVSVLGVDASMIDEKKMLVKMNDACLIFFM
jgi:hypothetical protein